MINSAEPQVCEETLLSATAAGDRRSFEQLFRIYYQRLGGFIRRLLAQPQAIEEVINDTMLAIWTSASRFQSKSKVDTWVFGIAYNKAMEHIRRQQRYSRHEVALEDNEIPEPTTGHHRDAREWVALALAKLSPEHRAVVDLTYTYGYSYTEIAQIVDSPAGTVKTRMFHARKLLKPVLERLADPKTMEKTHDL